MRTISVLAIVALATLGILLWLRPFAPELSRDSASRPDSEATRPIPVEVAPIERGSIERRRTFTGTLEARAELVVSPKIDGQIEELTVDLADRVGRGQVVARLDNDEHVQEVARAEADLAVAEANLAEAKSLLTIAKRELERIDTLRDRGVSSASQRDIAKAEELAAGAHLKVTAAQVESARAELATARIRLGYTEVIANWRGRSDERLVAERLVEEGQTVSANMPLYRIVELDPIKAVFFVTERDYALLKTGQPAELTTDAYPDERFEGRIARIAPVFRSATRQARVELGVANPGLRLKPGLFVRATLTLERSDAATIVPERALTRREDTRGVFVLDAAGEHVIWRPVKAGIRAGERIAVDGEGLTGRVVTLGQQFLDDGSAVVVAGADAAR